MAGVAAWCALATVIACSGTGGHPNGTDPDLLTHVDEWRTQLDERAAWLRARIGSSDWDIPRCRVEIRDPFVILSNLPVVTLSSIREQTLIAGRRALRQSYFVAEPDSPIAVMLFANDVTYRRGAFLLYGDEPTTPYGYFKPFQNVLVLNADPGTGTVMHELTHALLRPDFPECPSWFNEGLASLHEECEFTADGLRGLGNWRVTVLRTALARTGDEALHVRDLIATTTERFYDAEARGAYYAMARYLCLWMQQRGTLRAFYAAFRDHVADDPTGAGTLESIHGMSIDEIETDFRNWAGTQ